MSINIGDRVRLSTRAGMDEGKVVDKLWSGAYDCYLYSVQPDGYQKRSTLMYREEELELMPDRDEDNALEWRFEMAGTNTVVAVMTADGEEVTRGHGHIIHEGMIGWAQACSYAIKKAYENMDGAPVRKKADSHE